MSNSSDQIVKNIHLRAPQERVWRAISDPAQFGAWFGMRFDGPFVAGSSITGRIAPTTVDAEIAKLQEPHSGFAFSLLIDRIEPMHLFSFRWHPFAVDSSIDYSKEATTLVCFELAADGDGTLLTVTESGFDQIPLERRAKAFAANDGGWAMQMRLIEKFLSVEG